MAGRLQNEDFKTLSELTGAGGASNQLLNDTKIYITNAALASQLSSLITSGDVLTSASLLKLGLTTDSTTTGTAAALPAATKGILRLTNASLVSISTITGQAAGQYFVLINRTGNSILINDNDVANGIRTGTGAAMTVANNASVVIAYDSTSARSQVIGGSGSSITTPVSIANGGTGQTTASAAFNALSPMTTSGDLIYGGASGTGTRLGIGSSGQFLGISGGLPSWSTPSFSASSVNNLLVNAGIDFWQAGTSTTVANGSSTYLADQFYVKNSLGTNGVITYSQATAVTNGSKFGASVQITTAPTAAQANGCEFYQVLENAATIQTLGQSVSSSILVKALGNVNQVGIAIVYATTEVKPTTVLGTEATVTVNSSTFTLASVLNQAVSTTPTTSGVIGFRVRITGVSTGNTYDLNNGFIVEQAVLNIGSTAMSFARASNSIEQEIASCQRFYEKSYELTTNPGNNTTTGICQYWGAITGNKFGGMVFYKVRKRTGANITLYDKVGNSGKVSNANGDNQTGTIESTQGSTGFAVTTTAAGNERVLFHYVAESRI